jgi:sugar phosphate isomerase/epimerase
MRIGCCCDIHDASIAHAAGYDFIECKVTSLLPEEPDDAVAAIIDQHRASPVPVAAFNVFLPRDLKIVGPNVDNERIGNYVDSALRRVHQVGATIVVFGSGAARAIPDGFPPREAREQTVRFLHRVADAAERYDIVVVIPSSALPKQLTLPVKSIAPASKCWQTFITWTKNLSHSPT